MKRKIVLLICLVLFCAFTAITFSYAKIVEDAWGEVSYTDNQANDIISGIQDQVGDNAESVTVDVYGPPHGRVKIYVKIQFPDSNDGGSITEINDETRDHFLDGITPF